MKFDDHIYFEVKGYLDGRLGGLDLNSTIGNAFAFGRQDELTSDWLRGRLLEAQEDGYMSYSEALKLNDVYLDLIEKLKERY